MDCMLLHMRKNEGNTPSTSKMSLKARGHMTYLHKKGKGYSKGQGSVPTVKNPMFGDPPTLSGPLINFNSAGTRQKVDKC